MFRRLHLCPPWSKWDVWKRNSGLLPAPALLPGGGTATPPAALRPVTLGTQRSSRSDLQGRTCYLPLLPAALTRVRDRLAGSGVFPLVPV